MTTDKQFEDAILSEDDSLSNLTEEERIIAAKVLPALAEKANRLAEANNAERLNATVIELKEANQKALAAHVEELKASLTPPTVEELQCLLDQEYIELKLKVGKRSEMREFVLCELVQDDETFILKQVKTVVTTHLKDIELIKWEGSTLDRINKLIDVVPSVVDTLAMLCAKCLIPSDSKPSVDKDWVKANVSTKRVIDILTTQFEVNRYRDFFSQGSRLSQLVKMG